MDKLVSRKVVIAPDKFKGSLTATEAARAIARGVVVGVPGTECALCPMADGGEGTVDVFLERGAVRKMTRVCGPLGVPVDAVYAFSGDTAIIEMASASGLGLLEPSQYDPMHADTFGTGELIKAALDAGAKRLIIGIGGSSTNDAGTGMLRALGVRFFDEHERGIEGGILSYERLRTINLRDFDGRLARTVIEAAVDVDNPLCGPDGATFTFAAQKGAVLKQLGPLDRTLAHIADVVTQTIGQDYRNTPRSRSGRRLGFCAARVSWRQNGTGRAVNRT